MVPSGVFFVRVRTFPRAVVLKPPLDVVRLSVVDFHSVKLAHAGAVAFELVLLHTLVQSLF